jgi:hypothetical protein
MLSAQASAAGQAAPSWAGAPPNPTHAPSAAASQPGHPSGSSPPGQGASARGPDAGGAAGPDTLPPSAQQAPLFPRFSPEGGDPFAAGGAAQQQAQHAALKQNLQKLYGSLGLQHGSRSSLPDIREDEPQTSLPSDPPLAPRLPPYGRPPATRALSDDDLFGMQDLGAAAAAALPQAPPGAPPLLADLSQVGQLPAGSTQSRTLFVRNVDPSVPEDELRTLFEVGLPLPPALAATKCPRLTPRRALISPAAPASPRFRPELPTKGPGLLPSEHPPATYPPPPRPRRPLARCGRSTRRPRRAALWWCPTSTRAPPPWPSTPWAARCWRGSSWTCTSRSPRTTARRGRWALPVRQAVQSVCVGGGGEEGAAAAAARAVAAAAVSPAAGPLILSALWNRS